MRFGYLASFGAISVAIAGGFFAAMASWRGTIYVSGTTLGDANRDPAAIHKRHDLTAREGLEFLTSNKSRLLTAAHVIVKDDEVGLEFGHFLVKGNDGRRHLACKSQYHWLTLRFEAEGIAEAGEKPTLEIESPCVQLESDFSRLAAVWIPVSKIMGERPANMDWSTADHPDVNYKFDNMTTEWPTRWTLQSVRLSKDRSPVSGPRPQGHTHSEDEAEGFHETEAQETDSDESAPSIYFSGEKLRELLPHAITLDWKKPGY